MASDAAPIGEVNRRATVVVVVRDFEREPGLRVEIERLDLAARGADVERIGVTARQTFVSPRSVDEFGMREKSPESISRSVRVRRSMRPVKRRTAPFASR